MSPKEIQHVKDLLHWFTEEEPSVYFRLNEEEIRFLKEVYLIPWQESNYDNSFLNWNLNTKHIELNYLLKCFHGQHGFIKSQEAFDYISAIQPDLLEFHQNLTEEDILCGPLK